jgi:alkanesulfonate monooxygenase SsuD/methylene tetrahydromethanopterin reductase-like flavin-dependent oxidoreductase (luciferase family)
MADGVETARRLLRNEVVGTAHLPWVKHPSKVFMASSHPKGLHTAGRVADGVFINYGLQRDLVAQTEQLVAEGITAANRDPSEVEIWQIAAMDCTRDGDEARQQIGAILAFVTGYIIGGKHPATRGVPPEHHDAIAELLRRYSTRPGARDIKLVRDLGLFDYLSNRVAICGTPDECYAQAIAAKAAGIERLMFSVSVAVDPAEAVRSFGEHVLPRIRHR